jgi:hypothetical protein
MRPIPHFGRRSWWWVRERRGKRVFLLSLKRSRRNGLRAFSSGSGSKRRGPIVSCLAKAVTRHYRAGVFWPAAPSWPIPLRLRRALGPRRRAQADPALVPKLHGVLRRMVNPTASQEEPELREKPVETPPATRKMTTSQRAIAARNVIPAQNRAVKLDAASPIVNDVIPDGDEVKFAVTKEGSAAVLPQLMGKLRDIEANPSNKNLQAEFLTRRDTL